MGRGDDELFHFFELMDPKNATSVSSMRSNLLTETRGQPRVLDGQLLLVNPLVAMKRGNGLFRSGNEVLFVHGLVVGLFASFSGDLIKLVVKLRQLSNLLHDVFAHEEWGVQRDEVFLDQGLDGELDESLLQADGRSL